MKLSIVPIATLRQFALCSSAQRTRTRRRILRHFSAFLITGLISIISLGSARADTIAENTAGAFFTNFDIYAGQSFTTASAGPVSNITFNFFSNVPATTAYAIGTGFLLSIEYTGTPAGLSSSTPGFLGQASAAGGFYTFDPSLTLLAGTQYFFYENALIPQGTISGGNLYVGGHGYFATSGSSSFSRFVNSHNFRVTGTPTSVPENGMGALLLAFSSTILIVLRRALGLQGQDILN
jgi:hypothetical protein